MGYTVSEPEKRPLSASERQNAWLYAQLPREIWLESILGKTLSILLMIRSVHWTAAANRDSILGLDCESNRSSLSSSDVPRGFPP
jgi:hypothetical protein